jgi:ACS family tartrate transporter-like MFS transporter
MPDVLAKVRRRLIPFMFLLYIVAYLDRVNIGFAALQMNRDLGLSPAVYGFGAGIFFIGYFLFEVPSNLVMARVGARIWIARIMITWGLISAAMMFVRGPLSFYALRFLLGLAEAGFFPGMILYLTYWFPSRERAGAISLFMTAVALAGVVGGPVSGALLTLTGAGGLAGWQWLFLLEGIPAMLLGIVVLAYLPDGPEDAKWLTEEERKRITVRLKADTTPTVPTPTVRTPTVRTTTVRLKPDTTVTSVLADGRVWLLSLTYFCIVSALYGITFWMPTILQKLSGSSDFVVGLLSALPYLVAAIGMVLVGRHSDSTGERRWHLAGSAFVGAAGFILSAMTTSPALALASISIAAFGIFSAMPVFWASFDPVAPAPRRPTSSQPAFAAAAGIALINSIGNLGGFLGPYAIGLIRTATQSFTLALVALAGALVAGGMLALSISHQSSVDSRQS